MLNQVHEHIVNELGHSSRTDTIFIITAILFNLIVLGINSAVSGNAADDGSSAASDLVLFVFIIMTIVVNLISILALHLGRKTRQMLLNGLVAMYGDNNVDKYYDPLLVSNYGTRYLLFAAVILVLAITSILVPLIIRFV